jgi:hypothetical protein
MRPNQDLTYGGTWYGASIDAVRVQESDFSWIGGGGRIFGWTRGAGIRLLGCYNTFIHRVRFGNCAYGIVGSYFGSAFGGYTRYRSASDANDVGTSLWVGNSDFTGIFQTAVLVGVNGDYNAPAAGGFENTTFDRSTFGGSVTIDHCPFENIGSSVLRTTNTGPSIVRDVRVEEADCNSSLALFYASSCESFKLDGAYVLVTGTRSINKFSYTGALSSSVCNPLFLTRVDAIGVSPLLQNVVSAISASNGCQWVNGNATQTRLPTFINIRARASTQMQGTNAYMHSIIPQNDGGRIESVSTWGLKPSETPNGSLKDFTFINGPTANSLKPRSILVDGQMLEATDVGGTNWTWNSSTAVASLTVAPTKNIRAFF